MKRWAVLWAVVLLITWSNHFHNSFHFDDAHTITTNAWVHDVRNVPRFWVDGTMFSSLPANQGYRPLVSTSLAVDWWIAGGPNPFWFHVSTFVWFLVLLGCMYGLVVRMTGRPGVAFLTVATFGLHPVCAETVNYIIQRADLYAALGCVAALALYASGRPGLSLLPFALATFAKPTALVYPLLLAAYVALFESSAWRTVLMKTAPALLLTLVLAKLQQMMTPPSYSYGGTSEKAYLLTQPFVLWHTFCSFFWPLGLSADTDWKPFLTVWSAPAAGGFLFVGIVLFAIAYSWRRGLRPVTFGLLWFLLAFLPTAVVPLAEVTNDHRMFFPLIGLSLAVCDSLSRTRLDARLAVIPLLALSIGTWHRNQVWHTEESLWADVVQKSPHSGRGLMNYGLTQMAKGDYATALRSFQRAAQETPNYDYLEINTAIAYSGLHDETQAEAHFRRAVTLSPQTSPPHFFYARWLAEHGREADALEHLRAAVRLNPNDSDAQSLLTRVEEQQKSALAAAEASARSPQALVQLSLLYYQAGRYQDCIDTATRALALDPRNAEAYTNIAAGNLGLHQWDAAIAASRQALRLRPDLTLARNNLRYAEAMKASH